MICKAVIGVVPYDDVIQDLNGEQPGCPDQIPGEFPILGGGGRIARNLGDLDSSPTHYAGGIGLRYLVAKAQNLNVGVDLTYGEGETNFYVQIGDWFGR